MEQLERRLKGHSLPQAVNDCANRRASSCHSYHSSVAAAAENGRASSLHNNEATFSERRVQTMKGCCCISNQVGSTFTSIYTMVSAVLYLICGSMIIGLEANSAWKKKPPYALLVFFIFHCFFIASLLMAQSYLLLVGSMRRRPTLLFAWIVVHFIEYITRVDLLILLIVNSHISPFEPDYTVLTGFEKAAFALFSFATIFFITLMGLAADIWAFLLVGFRRAEIIEECQLRQLNTIAVIAEDLPVDSVYAGWTIPL